MCDAFYLLRKYTCASLHNWNKLHLPKGTDTNQSKQENQPLYPMKLLKRKQPDNASCTIPVSIMAQIEEFRGWEEVFWLAWMFWTFTYDTVLFLELRFADRAPQRCFYGWKGIIWIPIDWNEKNYFFAFVLQPMLKLLIESYKEEGGAEQNSLFYNDEKNNKNEKWLFLSPKQNIEVKMSLSTSF